MDLQGISSKAVYCKDRPVLIAEKKFKNRNNGLKSSKQTVQLHPLSLQFVEMKD